MADKAISELVAAEQITATDMFVLEQNGTAKKLTGQILLNWLTRAADGHGGISGIEKLSTNVLADTYRISMADTNTFDFVVTNGKGISSIKKTATSGLVDTYTIRYNDDTYGTFTVTNGAKGDPGDTAYVWIKYASQEPTVSSHSFGDVPDDWIGVYFGFSDTAPTDWQQYSWYKIKGGNGDTGDPATLVSASVTYQVGDSGTIIPSGVWSESIPSVAQGKYLWTRKVTQFNTGNPITEYSVSRMGLDGLGSVVSVAGVSPDINGNVKLNAEDVGALSIAGDIMEGPINMNGQSLTGLSAPTNETDATRKGYVDKNFLSAVESTDYHGCYYRTVNGVTEWLNPPAVSGVEYRTTERYANAVVYLKRIIYTGTSILGTSDGYVELSIPHGVTDIDYVVRVTGTVDKFQIIPYMTASGGSISIKSYDSTNIIVRFRNATWTNGTWRFDLYYTKA